MLATTCDLKGCTRTSKQTQATHDLCKSGVAFKHQSSKYNHKLNPSSPSSSDSADEIQVIEEPQTAIPIRAVQDHRHSDRHSDLDFGSVHSRKRRSSPLCERRKRDDLDLLIDFMDSSEDEDTARTGADRSVRGRDCRTKPLLQPMRTSPLHRSQRYDYSVDEVRAESPHLGSQIERGYRSSGRHPLREFDVTADIDGHHHIHHSHQQHAPRNCRANPHIPSGLEHEALVFDNFEDISSVSSASEQEQENKDPFDTHLHFVRPAMSICANPGAFVARESVCTPVGSLHAALDEANDDRSQRRRHRLGHHRAASELFPISSSPSKSIDTRATRRRATVGSESAYRWPALSRKADLSP